MAENDPAIMPTRNCKKCGSRHGATWREYCWSCWQIEEPDAFAKHVRATARVEGPDWPDDDTHGPFSSVHDDDILDDGDD